MNSIQLIGRLCADPELRQTGSGKAVASFRVAVSRPRKRDTTDYFACVAWERDGEIIAQYFKKGSQIGLTGEMQCRKYTDKNGNKREAWEVVVSSFDFVGSPRAKEETALPPSPEEFTPLDGEEDLPF